MLDGLHLLIQCALINRALHSSIGPADLDAWPIELVDIALAWAGEQHGGAG